MSKKVHEKLQIIHKHHLPYGIRDKGGFLFFFTKPNKYQGQEDRYRKETKEVFDLADYILAALEQREAHNEPKKDHG